MWVRFVETVKFWRRWRNKGPHQQPQHLAERMEMHMEHVGHGNVQIAPEGAQVTLMRMCEVGHGNVQVGHAGGDVISQVSHHRHTHHHVTVIQATAEASANEPHARMPSPAEHSAALHRMDLLRNRVAVLDYMHREFGTRMVIHLKSEQLFRLNRYLDVVLQDARNVIHRPSAQAKQRRKYKQS